MKTTKAKLSRAAMHRRRHIFSRSMKKIVNMVIKRNKQINKQVSG